MKLAFSGQARYPEMTDGYELYVRRSRTNEPVDLQKYTRVVKDYCRMIAEELERDGMIDLPSGLGSISAVKIRRKAHYRKGKFAWYGKWDPRRCRYDGSPFAFGVTFLPKRDKNQNLRCYGFVANRQLFKRMKEKYDNGCQWTPMTFNDEMI